MITVEWWHFVLVGVSVALLLLAAFAGPTEARDDSEGDAL